MDIYFEFYAQGRWVPLHVTSWEDAVEKALKYGYEVRRVRLYTIEETFNPNEDKK